MQTSTMALYTILLDYAGGTYVAQTEAMSEGEALMSWILKLGSDSLGDGPADDVAAAFQGNVDSPSLLEGLTNAWCANAVGSQGLALVNIVRTAA